MGNDSRVATGLAQIDAKKRNSKSIDGLWKFLDKVDSIVGEDTDDSWLSKIDRRPYSSQPPITTKPWNTSPPRIGDVGIAR